MTGQSAWQTIVQRAVLGTERVVAATPADLASDLQNVLDRIDASDAERALLTSAAIVGAYDAAGRLPVRAAPAPLPTAADLDDKPEAPPRVARFLTTMLEGEHSEVLREWLAAVAARGWRVPSHFLPTLLELGHGAAYLRAIILPVLGARGRWLAARNDDWSWASANPSSDDASLRDRWETGTPDERAAILATVRARDAALGRELLESTWQTEPAQLRAMFVARLEVGLSLDDEPFLERTLDDRRQEVRRIAGSVLCGLPASALVSRMTARAHAALHWTPPWLLKPAELVVDPPAEIDEATLRDGIERKPSRGMGERAWWLSQIVSAVPPHVWNRTWNVAPDTIISAAMKGDWAQALMEGWAVASVLHRDPDWVEALLDAGFPSDNATARAPSIPLLLGVLPVERREAFVTRLLRSEPGADRVVSFVAAADHAWTDAFANTVLAWLRTRLAAQATLGGAAEWQLREVLPRLALRVPPRLGGVGDKWLSGEHDKGMVRALERFMSIFTFRRQLAEELDR